ncbi:MAG: pyridoxal-phosphate dependent enzyme [Marinicella sp.]
MKNIHENILSTIGHTPVIKINKLGPKNVNIYVKMESFNPLSSVKDRLAAGIIETAESTGKLKPGQTVIEASSGNTGIGLAMVCAQKGYPLVIVMAENFSEERRKLLRFLGAKLVLTPAAYKGTGMKKKAQELAKKHDWFLCQQFENEANTLVHEQTTAVEIANDFADIGLDYWVSGYGTGGTLSGVAKGLKKLSPATKIVAAEPDNIQMLKSGIPQPDLEGASHPNARPHPVQGWAPDFIPRILSDDILSLIDYYQPVNGADALKYSKLLAQQEGLFVGISSGATFAAALALAETVPPGSHILCMLPDTGERYLSSVLFEDIDIHMNAEELAISHSTETARFDLPIAAPVIQLPVVKDLENADLQSVNQLIAVNKVLIFSLEWCDFCLSLKNFFQAWGVDFHAIDVDSAQMAENNHGAKIKHVVAAKTQSINLPQVYVAGELIGGFSDISKAYHTGRLQELFISNGINYKLLNINPDDFAPKWVGTANG